MLTSCKSSISTPGPGHGHLKASPLRPASCLGSRPSEEGSEPLEGAFLGHFYHNNSYARKEKTGELLTRWGQESTGKACRLRYMQHRYQWAASHFGDRRTPCPRSHSFGACARWPRAGCHAKFRQASINLVTVRLSEETPGWEGIRHATPAPQTIIITATPSPWAILSFP